MKKPNWKCWAKQVSHFWEGVEEVKQENQELKAALIETDLYYRHEVPIPNVRICKINFDLIKKD